MKSFSARVLAVIAVVSLIGNVLLYLRYSSGRPLVTVGSETITKKQYLDQLEHESGQAVLSKLVCDKLIAQEAARDGVTPTPQDIDARIKVIERIQPQLLTPYNQDPAKMDEFRQDIATNMALENLRIKDVALSPAAVAAYYAAHREMFKLPQQVRATTVVTQNKIDADTATDLLRQKTPPDVIARQPRLLVVGMNGYNPDLTALPVSLRQQISGFVNAAKIGAVKTFALAAPHQEPLFMTFQVTQSSRETVPPLTQIRDQVERQARLALAPTEQAEMARLYQAAKPTFNSDKYAAYFDGFQHEPSSQDGGKKTASVP